MKRMNLQLFIEPADGAGGIELSAGGQNQQQAQTQTGQQASLAIDYTKIQQTLGGTLVVKEDMAPKAYFKQQGLSQEEVGQAIAVFKQQRTASQPDVAALQQRATQAQVLVQQAQMQATATVATISLRIDAKTIPYVLKMADLSQVMGQDGKINNKALKAALNRVLGDVSALKLQVPRTTGFVQVGVASGQQQAVNEPMTLKDAILAVLKK